MAGKQRKVARPFRRVDPETGDVSEYEPGDHYPGPMEPEDHFVGPDGPDGKGPLLTEEVENVESDKSSSKGGK